MPLESAQYISDLNSANPVSTDSVAQADDHIRLIKSAIKATFPNITGPVTATHSALNAPIPTGIIVMWSGVTAPSGWALCDGTNGTPDLRNRFIVGAGTTYPLGTSGGSTTSSAGGGHTHTESAAGGHNHTGLTGDTALTIAQMPAHEHDLELKYTTVGGAGSSRQYWTKSAPDTLLDGTVTDGTSVEGEGATHNHSIGTDGSHSHTINAVGDHTHTATPPYYALAYIMKT
jgi:microcystin-dependent protein